MWTCIFSRFGEDCLHSGTFPDHRYRSQDSGCGRTLWRTVDLGICVNVLHSPYEHALFTKGLSLSPFALLLLCGSFTSGHWLVCSNSFPHWVHYECTCCFALVVEIIMMICHPQGNQLSSHPIEGPISIFLLQYPSLLQNTCVYVCMLYILMYLWQ